MFQRWSGVLKASHSHAGYGGLKQFVIRQQRVPDLRSTWPDRPPGAPARHARLPPRGEPKTSIQQQSYTLFTLVPSRTSTKLGPLPRMIDETHSKAFSRTPADALPPPPAAPLPPSPPLGATGLRFVAGARARCNGSMRKGRVGENARRMAPVGAVPSGPVTARTAPCRESRAASSRRAAARSVGARALLEPVPPAA